MDINLTLIGQIGSFLVFWWFVHKVIWPIFSTVVNERQQKIADGLSMSESARHYLKQAEQESEEILANAKKQANEILARAQKQANELVESAKSEAKKAGNLEIAQARSQIEQERQKVSTDLKNQLSDLVIQGTEKIVGREINAKDHDDLLQELIEKI